MATAATGTAPAETNVDSKILKDLGAVTEKITLCESMLRPADGSPAASLANNEALLGLVGFLEACAPRMVELVEAASQGALKEETLMECLTVNDRLLKALEDVETQAEIETPATTTAAAAPAAKPMEDQFAEFAVSDPAPAAAAAPAAGGDLLDLGSDAKPAAAAPKDDFDAFAAERAS